MSNRIEYNGYVIEPTTRLQDDSDRWTLEVRISPVGGRTGIRRCRGSNTYANERLAVANCLEFGRQIVDGKLKRRTAPSK